jgi:prepilin-type N-terminal cleavage/methylation domain-containing protein
VIKHVKKSEDQRGLSLIEVLTAIVLFAMVSSILYSFLFIGISMYKRVAADAQLRSNVNLIYSQLLEYADQSVYAFRGNQKNEIIVIKKESLKEEQQEDSTYIQYYSIKLDTENDQIIFQPVTGSDLNDRDQSRTKQFKLDDQRFDLDDTSSISVKEGNNRQQIVIDWNFKEKKVFKKSESPSIQIKSEIEIYNSK